MPRKLSLEEFRKTKQTIVFDQGELVELPLSQVKGLVVAPASADHPPFTLAFDRKRVRDT